MDGLKWALIISVLALALSACDIDLLDDHDPCDPDDDHDDHDHEPCEDDHDDDRAEGNGPRDETALE